MTTQDKPLSKRFKMSRKPTEKGKHWTDRDKLKVIASFYVLGNATKVEEVTGVPSNTINYWKTLPWWFEEMEKIRKTEDQTMASGYARIMHKTINKLEERIENGEVVVTKTGEQILKPVSARDLSIISGMAADKRMKLVQGASTDSIKQISMADRLKQLEDQFIKFHTSKVVEGQVTFKEISVEGPNYERIEERHQEARKEGVEAVREEGRYEDGKERLQEGEVLNA